ncbi:MAG: tRNA (adenosine(37)-N6)-threonylcarbamoyltransferase complex dimerization subunit type 1 TsaB [Sphingomonadaceae bacterium]
MRTLVIDSATEACSVALYDDDELLAGEHAMLGRGHAEQLVPMIARLPDRGKAQRIAVARGPGSFTGVRVGLAAARGLALAWGAQLVGYPTLALVAAMARKEVGAQALSVVMTGGHGEWFVESFDATGATSLPLASMKPDDAVEKLADVTIAGSQAEAFFAARGTGNALPLWPDARAFHLLPEFALGEDIAPIYGRGPDAKLPANAR